MYARVHPRPADARVCEGGSGRCRVPSADARREAASDTGQRGAQPGVVCVGGDAAQRSQQSEREERSKRAQRAEWGRPCLVAGCVDAIASRVAMHHYAARCCRELNSPARQRTKSDTAQRRLEC